MTNIAGNNEPREILRDSAATVPDDEPAVSVRGCNHYFGEGDLRDQILFDINLNIAAGEIVFILGPSGCGKTTLLTLLGALRTVIEGDVRVLGQELRGSSQDELIRARRNMGFIFQAHNLFESLTAFQNVRMGMELFGLSSREMKTRAIGLLKRLDLKNRVYHKPQELSGGQKQRVAVARGLAHKPRLVLADEPTAALDEKSGREVMNLFKECAEKDRCTILVVTHDSRILDVPDRTVKLEDGRVVANVVNAEVERTCKFLSTCSVFSKLSYVSLLDIADKMLKEKYAAGSTIFSQGDAGDKFYLVYSGVVSVVRDGQVLADLSDGKFFGETALINKDPRNATIIAKSDVEVLSLSDDVFNKVLSTTPSFEEEIRKALFARH